MKKIIVCTAALLAIIVGVYCIVRYNIMDLTLTSFFEGKETLDGKMGDFWTNALYLHVLSASIALIIGPIQFWRKIRETYKNFHRLIGILYLISVVFGGITGYYLSFTATGGWFPQLGYFLLNTYWLISTYYALMRIRQKNITSHQQWVLRNYSVTFSAVTLRLWLLVLVLSFGFEYLTQILLVLPWLSWVPNVIWVEWKIKRLEKTYVSERTLGENVQM